MLFVSKVYFLEALELSTSDVEQYVFIYFKLIIINF